MSLLGYDLDPLIVSVAVSLVCIIILLQSE